MESSNMKEKVLPPNDIVLQSIVDELTSTHNCHTVILYGSRARGDFTTGSDYDVAGIKETGEAERIARFDEKNGVYHDIFVYPENAFGVISNEHLCMSDGIVVIEKADFGTVLLKKLTAVIESSDSVTPEEITVRKVWYKKMLARASTKDLEGKYRHIWAIYTILEDYFVFRGLRYQGPKKAFQHLKIHDSEILSLFDEALSDINNVDILEKLIKKITQ
jgi:predicted nucleotidyltransferase